MIFILKTINPHTTRIFNLTYILSKFKALDLMLKYMFHNFFLIYIQASHLHKSTNLLLFMIL